MSNIGGVIDLDESKNTAEEFMARYDSLPPEVRKVVREAAFNLMPKEGTWGTLAQNVNTLEDTMRYAQRQSSRATYGANYPVDIPLVRV